MKKTTKEFLNGEMTESEFYNLPKEDLITLKEYYERLKEIDKKFQFLASLDIKKIKIKLDWVDGVSFAPMLLPTEYGLIHLFTKDKDDIIAVYDEDAEMYEALTRKIPKISFINPKVKTYMKRTEDLKLIQTELKKIESAGRFIYDGVLEGIVSISGKFYINYVPGYQLHVSTLYDSVACFNQRDLLKKEKTYLDDNHKSKLLTMVQLKNKYSPKSNC